MPSPFVIALLSIIPGLGFVVMKKVKIGFSIWGCLLLCFIIFMVSSNEMIYNIAFQLAILIWFGQIFFAYREAKRMQEIENGTVTGVSDSTNEEIIYPIDLPFKERQTYKAMEIIRRQAELGEQVYHAVLARILPSVGSHALYGAFAFANMRQFYLGETSKGLILVEVDWLGKPAEVSRIAKENINSIVYKKGLANDKLIIRSIEQQELSCNTHYLFRNQTKAIVNAFSKPEE